MDRDANYVAVGAFTLLIMAMAVAFVMWYSDTGDHHDYTPYEIYFSGSVAGLNEGSAVRYLGVDVGTVRRITLSKERPDSVKVLVFIDATAPISGNTRASLGLQGITGLLFINLKQVPGVDGQLHDGDKYPVIESQSSDIDAFLATLPQLAGRITVLIDNVNKVFSDDNVKAIGDTLNSLRRASVNLPHASEQIQALLAELTETSNEIKSAAANINGMMDDVRPNVRDAISKLNAVSTQLANTTARLDRFMASSEAPLTHFTEQGLFEVERMLRDVRSAASEFRELSRSLKQTPSQLLFEKPESGMEIKR
jgi:phospholipid/cholesterol/gamma-HCH transport system substrate-binding protein